jgi:hypothetical protein
VPKRQQRSAEAFTVVLLADQSLPVDQQSRFRFRPLTQAEKLAVLDGLNWTRITREGETELMPRSFQQARELVIDHLEGAENFPTDGPMPWPATASREEKAKYLEMLSEFDLLELGNELRHRAQPDRPVETPSGEVSVPNS